MTWNYRVFRENESDYVIREVFYAEDGIILGCTSDPVEPFGQSLDELAHAIDDFKAALALPMLTFDDIPQPAETAPSRQHSHTIRQEDIRATLGLADDPESLKSAPKPSRRKTA